MSESLLVRGGKALSGTIRPSGNKNAVLPMLCATLLTDEPVVINNVPEITDVAKIVGFFETIGSDVDWDRDEHTIQVCHRGVRLDVVDSLPPGMRSSVMLFGPLLSRVGQLNVTDDATGCSLGAREVDPHLDILEGFGAAIEWGDRRELRLTDPFQANDHWLDYASVTTTEHFVMCAVVAQGTSRLVNAASEPHVQDLCTALVAMGANIEGIGTSVLTVTGVESLHGAELHVSDDHHEIFTFLAIGAMTGGDVTVEHSVQRHFPLMDRVLNRFGVDVETTAIGSRVSGSGELRIEAPRTENLLPKVEGAPWPYFPVDLIPPVVALGTVADGTMLFWNKVYEGAFGWVPELMKFGAQVTVCDPHRIIVSGRDDLRPAVVEAPYIIRVIISLFMVGATIDGESAINNASPVRRAHPNFVENLRSLGADVAWVDD
ncbi:MAG: UDP-N-acetylglucosamine 1-carboxyvinyltransferase [Actinomycetota bacterium]